MFQVDVYDFGDGVHFVMSSATLGGRNVSELLLAKLFSTMALVEKRARPDSPLRGLFNPFEADWATFEGWTDKKVKLDTLSQVA